MSMLTIELPDSLKKRIEALAAKEGYSISQFLASAAGEKLAVMQTMGYLRQEAKRGRREDFDKYLAARSQRAAAGQRPSRLTLRLDKP
jgi:predicted transcriptional regulator